MIAPSGGVFPPGAPGGEGGGGARLYLQRGAAGGWNSRDWGLGTRDWELPLLFPSPLSPVPSPAASCRSTVTSSRIQNDRPCVPITTSSSLITRSRIDVA